MPLNDADRAAAREGLRLALRVLGRAPTPTEAALLETPRSGAFLTPSDPAASGRVTEEQYAKMSHAERMDYARRFNGGRQ